MADAGKFNIAITGDSSSFRNELGKTVTAAKTAAGQISGAFKSVQGVLAGLGVGLSIAGFTDFVKTTIDALDRLGELSEIAGISATKLGGLAFAAKQSGVEIEQLSKGIKFLNVELAKAQSGDKGSQELFRKLSIDPSKVTADEALLKIADSFAKYADGAGKAQIATTAFGKAGEQLIPLLNQGGEQLRQQIAYYEKYSGVTDDLVAKSNEFNDTLDKLSLLTGRFGKQLVAELLPSMQGLVTVFIEGKEKGDDFKDSVQDVADVIKGLAIGVVATATELSALGHAFGAIGAEINALARLDIAAIKFIEAEAERDQNARYARMQRLIDAIQGRVAATPGPGRPKGLPPAPTLGGGVGNIKTEVDDFAKQMQRVREMAAEAGAELREAFSGEKLTGGMKALEKLMASDAWAKFTEAQQAQLKGAYEQVSALQKETEAWKQKREEQEKLIKVYQDIQAAEEKARVAGTAALGDFAEKNDEFEKHIKIIGKGQKAYDLLNAEIEQNKRIQANIGADQATIELMNQQYERQKKLIEAYHDATEAQRIFAEEAKAMQEVKNMISDTFANAFTDFITGAKSAKDAFKSFANDMVQQLSRIAAQNIANALFGGKNAGGPDVFGVLSKLLFMWGGGTSGIAGPVSPDLSGGGLAFAASGGMVTRGGWAMVGEHGAEIVHLPTKSRVTPHHEINQGGGGVTIVQNINVPRGADSATLRQSAKQAFALAAGQMRRG